MAYFWNTHKEEIKMAAPFIIGFVAGLIVSALF